MHLESNRKAEKELKEIEEQINGINRANEELRQEQLIKQYDLKDIIMQQKTLQKKYQQTHQSLRVFEENKDFQKSLFLSKKL